MQLTKAAAAMTVWEQWHIYHPIQHCLPIPNIPVPVTGDPSAGQAPEGDPVLVWEAAAHSTLLKGTILRKTLISTELIHLEQTSPE